MSAGEMDMVKKRVIESVVSPDPMTKRWKAKFSTGRMAYESGDLKQASALLTTALEMAKELPEKSFAVPACEIAIAAVMLAEGKTKEAEAKLSRSVAGLQGAAQFEEKELLGVALRFHAEALIAAGDEREAEKELLKSIEVFESLGVDGVVQRAYSLCDLCSVYLAQGRMSQAEQHITNAMAIFGKVFGPEHPEYTRADMLYTTFSPMSEGSRMDTISDGIQRMEYVYGAKHPNISRAVNRYLQILEGKGDKERLKEAKDRFANVLK
jgi:ATP/maltotriose-dependent transcriptional regulator MalT